MKKKLTVIFAMLLCFLVPMSIEAADKTANSEATVTFTADTEPTTPVDPEDPDQPIVDPGTGMEGPLSIDYVPYLDFDSHVITGEIETYQVKDTRTHIQVTDKRGTGSGWKVSAALSDFVATTDATKKLHGAVVNFGNVSAVTTTGNLSPAPAISNFSLTAGGASSVVADATADKGMGIWVERWFASDLSATSNDHVKLTVNTADAYAKTYKATLTWTLSTAP